MKYFKPFIIAAFFFLLQKPAHSQMITGKVIGESGYKAAGISVNFVNRRNAVFTNRDGSFKIMATSLPDTLIFSALGYESYKVVVTDKTVIDPDFEIVLLEKRGHLDEVVVSTALSAKRKESVAYSSASVSSRGMSSAPHPALAKGKADRKSGVSYEHDMNPDIRYESSGAAAESVAYKKMSMSSGGRVSSASGDYSSGIESGRKIYSSDTISCPTEITRTSQLLSAGEVNDFKKWKMWEDYNEGVFKSLSTKWGFYPTHRYSISIENKNHREVTGEPVYLINKSTHDTAWRTITDNTGKAELWSGFNKPDSGEYYITTRNQEIISSPTEFANGMNKAQLKKDCNISDKVEIAFVVDATGSMQDEIDYLKLELEDVIRKTFEKNSTLNLKVGSVFYRDKDDEYLTKHINFQSDLLKVLNFIKLQRAGGGGDYPEGVNAALRTAIDSLSWSDDARSKILFLVLDAPPHDEAAKEMYDLIAKAAAKGIRIVPIACSGTDKSTEFIMRSMALATNGTYLFLTDHSGIGGSHIKPTTDAFDVELLNTLLQRTIEQMIFVHPCAAGSKTIEPYKPFQNTDSLKVYPNPTNGKFYIETSKPLKEIFVTDFTGKILQRISLNAKAQKYNIDISGYPSATYLIRYITTDDKWGTEKVVLIH